MSLPPTGDDLDKPLGTDIVSRSRADRDVPYLGFGIAGVGVLVVCLGVFVYVTGDPAGGQPYAVAAIEPQAKPAEVIPTDTLPTGSVKASAHNTPPLAAETSRGPDAPKGFDLPEGSVTEVEEQNGVKVIRLGKGASAAKIIRLPRQSDAEPAERPRLAAVGSPESRGPDPVTGAFRGGPRVSIVVGGMGLNKAATADAAVRLPPQISFAFAPYGSDLGGQVARAKGRGHEIVLQVPMEAFDSSAADPGVRTLTISAGATRNVESLHWLMGRFTGYVGVMNYLGGKFTADADALAPVLRDLAGRRLLYVDDGTSSRTVTQSLAQRMNTSVVMTDVVLDSDAGTAAIEAALARLEAIARTKGLAVGSASGRPDAIAALERWSRSAQARGIVLVPVSAAASAARRISVAPDR